MLLDAYSCSISFETNIGSYKRAFLPGVMTALHHSMGLQTWLGKFLTRWRILGNQQG